MKFLSALFLTLISISTGYSEESKELLVEVIGAQIYCRAVGEGDPLIVIHGGPGLTQDYLLPQMDRLAETHRVIFYDQRGCGRSTGKIDADSMQIKTYLEDLEAVREAFGYKKVAVLGHSWGGFLAMQYAIAHPEAVDKLILLNTMSPSSEEFTLFVKEWTQRMAPYLETLNAIKESKEFAMGDPKSCERYYQIIFRRYCYNPDKADLLNLSLSPKAAIDGSKIYALFRENLFTKPFDFHDQLQALSMPTLIIHGDCDPIPASTAQRLHESIPGSKFILLPSCGHFPYVESPEELFHELRGFLSQTTSDESSKIDCFPSFLPPENAA